MVNLGKTRINTPFVPVNIAAHQLQRARRLSSPTAQVTITPSTAPSHSPKLSVKSVVGLAVGDRHRDCGPL
jgi:hypothetical protein